MGRSYQFECPKCGYHATVSGKVDRGSHFSIQTILCRDCKELYDAIIRLNNGNLSAGFELPRLPNNLRHRNQKPPKFEEVLSRLPPKPASANRWMRFKPACPVSVLHRVRAWNTPDRCPRCSVYLERSALPFRIWD